MKLSEVWRLAATHINSAEWRIMLYQVYSFYTECSNSVIVLGKSSFSFDVRTCWWKELARDTESDTC